MASNVDESSSSVITRTNTFSSTDSKVYSWLSLGNVGETTVYWHWYSPDLNLFKTISANIPPNPSGGYWPSYNVWSYLDIAEDTPSDLPGNWHVDVYLDGQKLLTEQFTLEANAIQLNPDNATAWYNKGNDLSDQGKYDEAIQAYNKAIEIDPQDADAWNAKGVAFGKLGWTAESNAALAKAKDLGYTG